MQFSSSRLYYLFEVEGWPKEGDMTDSTITPLLQWRILTRLFFFSNSSSLIRKTRSKTWFNLEGKKDRKFEEAASSSQNHKFSCSELRFDNDDSSNLITYCTRLLILTIREAFTQCHMEHLRDRADKKIGALVYDSVSKNLENHKSDDETSSRVVTYWNWSTMANEA